MDTVSILAIALMILGATILIGAVFAMLVVRYLRSQYIGEVDDLYEYYTRAGQDRE